ncbi:uncharacterized protein G2W53_010345 [Senna tora]|uniref:Uncharacterized protein n=1 Tax=Senna tora TaxID=362788 RepID=A0A835CB88_9FABA|nr:uncharacterized protein G2W53_010345 [Senna tora]
MFTNYKSKVLLRKNVHDVRVKTLGVQVSETDRFALYLRNRVDLMLELESSWHGRSVNHALTYFGREIAVGSQKRSRLRIVFAKRSGFDASTGVVMAWKVCESCLNIFQMRNRGRISEKVTKYSSKVLLHNRHGMEGACIMSYQILEEKSWSNLRNVPKVQVKSLVAQVTGTDRLALYLRNSVDLILELESSWHGRSVSETDRFTLYLQNRVDLMLELELS